jgi:hypothetical protein
VAEQSGPELLREWRKLMDSVVTAATSVTPQSELPRRLLQPMQRQLELVQDILERERRLQKELAGQLAAPVDAVLGLLEESGATLRRQAEALEAAGRALEEAGGLMKHQAAAFERTIDLLHQPAEVARTAAGLDKRPRKRGRRRAT